MGRAALPCPMFQPNSNGLQPNSDGLQPNSDGLQSSRDGLQPNSTVLHAILLLQYRFQLSSTFLFCLAKTHGVKLMSWLSTALLRHPSGLYKKYAHGLRGHEAAISALWPGAKFAQTTVFSPNCRLTNHIYIAILSGESHAEGPLL